MSISLDPEQNEPRALLEFTGPLAGKRIFEIGAGDGRLTWRYADQAGEVVCIEPDPNLVAQAQEDLPADLQGRVRFLNTSIADYQHDRQAPLFDLALMSWAL